tara:strand:- start:15805 stop:16464 length:660 start_codon:yes stop_codon:yes gene_type:complete
MRKKSIDTETQTDIKTPIVRKDSVLNILKNRLEIVEDRLTEIAYLLEYDFESLDDSSRTAMLETKLREQIALKKQREEEDARRIKEQEELRIQEAAQILLDERIKAEENKRIIEMAANDLLKRQQIELEAEQKRLKELNDEQKLLSIAKEKQAATLREAEAEKQKLELKEQFDQKIKEEDESIKEAKEKAAVDPFENPYPKGSIEHVVWKRKQQAKKKR